MKKIIKKFWGVGLVIVLLSSLFVTAAPVSAAEPLRWEAKIDAPSTIFGVLAPGTDVVDYDVAANGFVMYAVTGAAVMQSTMGGAMWTNVSAKLPATLLGSYNFVAMAPDDPNIVVVASNTANRTAITVNGGATWTDMGVIQDLAGTDTIQTISGVRVSPVVTGGIRYVAVYGTSAAGQVAALYYYNYGSGVGAWREAMTDIVGGTPPVATTNQTLAFEFSPNFPSDLMGLAVLSDNSSAGAGDFIELDMINFNLAGTWNSEIGYPVPIYTSAGVLTVNSASLALHPDYDGADESLRIAFAGAAMLDGVTEVGGVFRCVDSAPVAQILGTAVAGIPINSVAFDGTNLAAGSYTTNNVYRSDGPLSSSPTFLGARNLKRIGIDDTVGADAADQVQVKFVGETLYGAKIGDASALSKSLDYGNTWNDYTLMDAGVGFPFFNAGTTQDLYMSAAGDPWYIAANDAITAAIYRISMFSVTRVLCVAVGPTFTLAGIGADANVLYAADTGTSTVIYYTADGGLTRWFARTALPIVTGIQDVAVESAGVVYVGDTGTTNVYKSINKGFSWAAAVDCKLSGGNTINTMLSLGENKMVIGGTAGGVTYTKDGGATWTNTMGVFNTFGPVIATASGLEAGDYLFAAETLNKMVWRCELGPANPFGEFKSMNAPAGSGNGETNRGLVYYNGVLYAMSHNGTAATGITYLNNTLIPTVAGTHAAAMWGTQYVSAAAVVMGALPRALKVSAGAPGSVMLYTYNIGTNGVFYLDDNVALGAPVLIGPADDYLVQIVSALTGAVQPVNFTWSRLSKATGYQLQVALDSGFNEQLAGSPFGVGTVGGAGVANTADPVSAILNAGGLLAPLFQPGTTYYWRVRSTDPITSGWSETRTFTVQPTAASVPSISSPAVGATLDSVSPAFSWAPVSGATMYKFELSESVDFATTVYTVDTAGAGAMLPAGTTLVRGKTYFWRVKALTPVESDWSTVANFVVAAAQAPPAPPVVVTNPPQITITIPPAPPATEIVIPAPPAEKVINPTYIWAIIIIGAILVIAVIVLIVRTRRSV